MENAIILIIIIFILIAMVKFLFSDTPGDGITWDKNHIRVTHRSKFANAFRGFAKIVVFLILLSLILACCSAL